MFLVVSRSDVHFGFDHPFFECPIGRARKIARPKSRAPKKKFVHPWITAFSNINQKRNSAQI